MSSFKHLTRREAFSLSVARKLLERLEGTALEMDTRRAPALGRAYVRACPKNPPK
jgi:hypothetical protein